MTFLIGGANSLTGGYDINNSLRFNDDDDANLTLNPGTSSDNKTCTLSWWVKLGVAVGNGTDYHFSNHTDANNRLRAHISNTGEFALFGKLSGSTFVDIYTNAQYKDPSAWYHFMVILDSTDGTAADRTQLWINGLRNTDVTLGTSPDEYADMIWGSRDNMTIGAGHSGSAANANPYDGYFAEMHFIDGQKKASTDFGKFNDNGVWIPKKYSGTYGTNGWFMEFKQTGTSQNSSGIGADTSGNDNHFAVTNSVATDVTTDTPTNNFATLNPLMAGRSSTLSEGNLKVTGESDNTYDVATFGSSMKWYMEWKVDENFDGSGGGIRIGAIHVDDVQVAFGSLGNTTAKYYTNSNDGKTQFGGGNNETTGLTRATTNDIIMCACDGAGAKIWWGINGTWLDYGSGAGDPAAGNNAAPWTNAMKAGIWFPATVYSGTAASGTLNLGNPPNAISSSQADDNGYGNFEYDVPAGFYSLCTKNLAEFG